VIKYTYPCGFMD